MGKGDKRTKKGKRTAGTYGVIRPRRKAASAEKTAKKSNN